MIIGFERTFRFFFQRYKIKATALFFGGIAIVLFGWPLIGMIVEIYGFFLLFGYISFPFSHLANSSFPVASFLLRSTSFDVCQSLAPFCYCPVSDKWVTHLDSGIDIISHFFSFSWSTDCVRVDQWCSDVFLYLLHTHVLSFSSLFCLCLKLSRKEKHQVIHSAEEGFFYYLIGIFKIQSFQMISSK